MRKILCGAFLSLICLTAVGQRVGIKTNALYWMTGTANAGLELRLSRHYTLNLEGAVNPFSFGDTRVHVAAFLPEVRYWFTARPGAGHSVGLMGVATGYNLHFSSTTHHGDALGAGLTYAYSWVLGKRWNMEASCGLGVVRLHEKKYDDGTPAPTTANNRCFRVAPLKLGLSFVYLIK